MNPYKEDGPRARLSFDRAYCKRCIGASSVNDGYITGTGCQTGRLKRPQAGRTRPCRGLRHRAAARPAAPAREARRETLSPRLKLSFGSAATRPL